MDHIGARHLERLLQGTRWITARGRLFKRLFKQPCATVVVENTLLETHNAPKCGRIVDNAIKGTAHSLESKKFEYSIAVMGRSPH